MCMVQMVPITWMRVLTMTWPTLELALLHTDKVDNALLVIGQKSIGREHSRMEELSLTLEPNPVVGQSGSKLATMMFSDAGNWPFHSSMREIAHVSIAHHSTLMEVLSLNLLLVVNRFLSTPILTSILMCLIAEDNKVSLNKYLSHEQQPCSPTTACTCTGWRLNLSSKIWSSLLTVLMVPLPQIRLLSLNISKEMMPLNNGLGTRRLELCLMLNLDKASAMNPIWEQARIGARTPRKITMVLWQPKRQPQMQQTSSMMMPPEQSQWKEHIVAMSGMDSLNLHSLMN